MFAKTKCFMVLSRTGRYVQSRSIRKTSQLKYSAASIEGLSSVKRSRSLNIADGDTPEKYSEDFSQYKTQYGKRLIVNKKATLDELLIQAEELLECRFHRSRSSPIGVGLSIPDSKQEPYFNLLPSWFAGDSSFISSRIPALLGSGHPILRLKQNIDPEDKEHSLSLLSNNVQWRAFVILLVSRALMRPSALSEGKKSLELRNARIKTLSEIAEMMNFAFSLHRTIVEIKHSKEVAMEEKESSLQLGNKIAILLGDLLLSRTSKGLSALKNATVTELMSDAISDFSESEVLRRRHYEFFETAISSNGGSADVFRELANLSDRSTNSLQVPSFESWKTRVSLDVASLIGRSCLSSALLSQLDEGACNLAFNIGRQIGLVIQAYNDLESFTRGKNLTHPSIDLCTLPVVFHLSNDSIEKIQKPVDISEIYHGVMTSPDALHKSQNALEKLRADALRLISTLPRSSAAPDILKEFVVTLS